MGTALLALVCLFIVVWVVEARICEAPVVEQALELRSIVAAAICVVIVLLAYWDSTEVFGRGHRWRFTLFVLWPSMAYAGVAFPESFISIRDVSWSGISAVRGFSWVSLALLTFASSIMWAYA